MANPEHLRILGQGAWAWNKWRSENPNVEPDLTGHIFNCVLWIHMDFRGANFLKSSIICSELPYVDFSHAFLKEVNFNETALEEASFRCATLTWANFSHTKLNGADFNDAHLGWTTFGKNDLSQVQGLDTVNHLGPSVIGLETIYRSGGNIPEVFLRGCGVPEEFITYMHSLTGKAIEFYSCFISYSSKDEEFAKRLYNDLQSEGVRCWFAPEDLKIGERFRAQIDESIRLYDKLLLVLSENSVVSEWVEKEVETAFEKESEQEKIVLFPVRLDDTVLKTKTGWAADVRRSRHIGDFRDWKNHDAYKKAFERLTRALKAEARR